MNQSLFYVLSCIIYLTDSKKTKVKTDANFLQILSELAPHTFDFGDTLESDVTLYKAKGVIPADDKVSKIPIKIRDCHDLRFVQVNITNLNTLPSVNVDFRKQQATIRYDWVQLSRSLYSLEARGRSRCAFAHHLNNYYVTKGSSPPTKPRRTHKRRKHHRVY